MEGRVLNITGLTSAGTAVIINGKLEGNDVRVTDASSFNVGAAGHVYSDGVVDGGVGPLTPSLMVKVKAAGTITVAAGGVVEASNMLLEGGSLTVNGNIKADGLGYQPGKITCGMLR